MEKSTAHVYTSICTHLHSFLLTAAERQRQAVSFLGSISFSKYLAREYSCKITGTFFFLFPVHPLLPESWAFVHHVTSFWDVLVQPHFLRHEAVIQTLPSLRTSPKLPQPAKQKSSLPSDFYCMLLSFLLHNRSRAASSHRCLLTSGLKLLKGRDLALFSGEPPNSERCTLLYAQDGPSMFADLHLSSSVSRISRKHQTKRRHRGRHGKQRYLK